MSLTEGKTVFIEGMVALQEEMMTREVDSFRWYAEQVADLIESFIKSAKVTVDANIQVATTGTATAQTGVTTTKGNGNLS